MDENDEFKDIWVGVDNAGIRAEAEILRNWRSVSWGVGEC